MYVQRSGEWLSMRQLVEMSRGVASALRHLAQLRLVHRVS